MQLALRIYLNREEALKQFKDVKGNTRHLRDLLDEFLLQELKNESGYEYDAEAVKEVLDSCNADMFR